MKATCGSCDNEWPGETARAHCSVCHHTFSNAKLFDAHRWARGRGHGCLHPTRIELTLKDGTWYSKEDDDG